MPVAVDVLKPELAFVGAAAEDGAGVVVVTAGATVLALVVGACVVGAAAVRVAQEEVAPAISPSSAPEHVQVPFIMASVMHFVKAAWAAGPHMQTLSSKPLQGALGTHSSRPGHCPIRAERQQEYTGFATEHLSVEAYTALGHALIVTSGGEADEGEGVGDERRLHCKRAV